MVRSIRRITSSLILSLVTIYAALGQVQFKQPIYISLSALPGQVDTLWLGVSGDGPNPPGTIIDNTYLVDNTPEFGAWGSYRESQFPGDPPPPFNFYSKWIDIPGRTGMGAIRPWDFRGYSSASQVDTFQIKVNGDGMSGPDYAGYVASSKITLRWQSNLHDNADTWVLKKRVGVSYVTVVSDMGAPGVTSWTDDNTLMLDLVRYLIIKSSFVDLAGFSATPNPLIFGPRPAGSTNNLTLTISSIGFAPLTISSISVSNPVFSIIPAPPVIITPGASQAFTVTYAAPVSFETQIGTISFISNAPTSPDNILVTGTSAMNVLSGWNIVSVPLVQSNDSAVVIFPDLYGDPMEYVPGTGYVPAPILALGTGYWLNYVNPNVTVIDGTEPGSIVFNASLGWNIMGSRNSSVDVSSLVVSGGNTIFGGSVYLFVSGTGYIPVDSINPGQGAWVYITGPSPTCTITIPSP